MKKTRKVQLDEQELNDLWSAVGFFIRKFPDRKKNPKTMQAMKKLNKKIFKELVRVL